MTEKEKAQLLHALNSEVATMPVIEMSIATHELINMIGFLQLALRHPQASQTKSAKNLKELILDFRNTLFQDSPNTQKIIDLGLENQGFILDSKSPASN